MPLFGNQGERIAYTVHGASGGPPIVLIHGFTASSASFVANIPALATQFTVVTVDLLGHGESEAPAESAPYAPGPAVARIVALLDHLGLETVLLCGHSLGGALALRIALEAPERVEGLVVINSNSAAGTPEWREAARTAMLQMARRARSEGTGFLRQTRLYPAHSKRLPAEARDLLVRDFNRLTPRGFAGTAEALAIDVNAYERLPELRVPTLIVIGDRDADFVRNADQFIRRLPARTTEAITLPEAGHAANLEQPDLFHAAVVDFAGRLGLFGAFTFDDELEEDGKPPAYWGEVEPVASPAVADPGESGALVRSGSALDTQTVVLEAAVSGGDAAPASSPGEASWATPDEELQEAPDAAEATEAVADHGAGPPPPETSSEAESAELVMSVVGPTLVATDWAPGLRNGSGEYEAIAIAAPARARSHVLTALGVMLVVSGATLLVASFAFNRPEQPSQAAFVPIEASAPVATPTQAAAVSGVRTAGVSADVSPSAGVGGATATTAAASTPVPASPAQGATATSTATQATATATPSTPYAAISGPSTANPGEDVTFVSRSAPTQEILTMRWTALGVTKNVGGAIQVSFPAPGCYPVTLTVIFVPPTPTKTATVNVSVGGVPCN